MRLLPRHVCAAIFAVAASAFLGPGAGTAGAAEVLLAAGDIASCTSTGDDATATLLDQNPGVVATLGDNAYPSGTPSEFAACYDPTWGRAKARTRPAAGNHDYYTPGAAGYFGYFGAAAGDPSTGYYSYDLGGWHVIVLNSTCSSVFGGCGAGSPQEQWLRADLAANPARCTLAYWHHARFGSGRGSAIGAIEPFWQALYEHGADVILAGHDHIYDRLAPQTPNGDPNAQYGIRSFVVGTGGHSHGRIVTRPPTSEVANADTFGILKLTLRSDGYDWLFLPEPGRTFTDAGSGRCHGAPPDVTPPSVSLTAPSERAVLRGPATLAADAADNTAVARVDFLIDGTVVATDDTAPYSPTWDSASYPDGLRMLKARAVDRFGHATTSPGRWVVIDNTLPDTAIRRGPSGIVSSATATFHFWSEPGATFACSLDNRAFVSCANPMTYTGLRAGSHTFRVRARDAAGKVDPTPAGATWAIDLTAPITTITFSQTSRAVPGAATFKFGSTERSSFQCSLDGSPWATCASPAAYGGLLAGQHSFRVRARDVAGNTDWSPATQTWSVAAIGTGAVVTGSERSDVLVGTPGDDVIRGLGGNDVIRALGGNDVVDGALGNDRIGGSVGDDRLVGGPGADVVDGALGNDRLAGGTGNDRLGGGGSGDDRLWGDTGNDLLAGGSGDDRVWGGTGNDRMGGGVGNDRLLGGRGGDTLGGGPGRDTLLARDRARDLVDGDRGRDRARVDRRLDRVRSVEARI